MTRTSSRRLTLYFPLWGATFDSENAGAIGNSVIIAVPYLEEWRMIQKTDVAAECAHAEIPPCLTAWETLDAHESIDEAIARAGGAMKSKLIESRIIG